MRLTLDTERLILRPPEDADAPALARALDDYEIARMTAGIPHPYTEEVARGWIMIAQVLWRRRKSFPWTVEAKGEGLAGGAGVFKRRPDAEWEIGYWVARPFWRRGYAREAVDAIVEWARSDLGARRLVAGYFEDNPTSGRLLESRGFAPTGSVCNDFSIARGGRARCVGMALDLQDLGRVA